jgi:hypothetical protein
MAICISHERNIKKKFIKKSKSKSEKEKDIDKNNQNNKEYYSNNNYNIIKAEFIINENQEEDQDEINNKNIYICKFCGILIDENNQNLTIKPNTKNQRQIFPQEINLLDIIEYNFNCKETKKLTLSSINNNNNNFNNNFNINFTNSKYNSNLYTNTNSIKSPLRQNSNLIKKYFSERSDILKYLNKLIKQFKYTDKTLFFCISIFDTIIFYINSHQEKIYNELKLDVILISCLLIAGK